MGGELVARVEDDVDRAQARLPERPPSRFVGGVEGALDPPFVLCSLPEVAKAGTAILLVEQDIDTALSISQVAYVIDTGRNTNESIGW